MPMVKHQCERNFQGGEINIHHKGNWAQVGPETLCSDGTIAHTKFDNMTHYSATGTGNVPN